MVKQINEQVEILQAHLGRGTVDLDFISGHALHLWQLAEEMKSEAIASEASERHREYTRLIQA